MGLLLENKNSLLLGGHINDHSSVMIRMRGIEAIMRDVIALDNTPDFQSQNKSVAPMNWRPEAVESTTVNYFVRQAAIKYSGGRQFQSGDDASTY